MMDSAGKLTIIEYKGGTAKLSTGPPRQMSRAWVQKNIDRLLTSGDPNAVAWAEQLQGALDAGNLRGVVYSTPVTDGIAGTTTTLTGWPKTY